MGDWNVIVTTPQPNASQTQSISTYQHISFLIADWKWEEMDENKIISAGKDRIVASQHRKLSQPQIGHKRQWSSELQPEYKQSDKYLFDSYLLTRWNWAIAQDQNKCTEGDWHQKSFCSVTWFQASITQKNSEQLTRIKWKDWRC